MSNITGGGNFVSVESILNKNIALSLANIIKIVINDANNNNNNSFWKIMKTSAKPAIEAEVGKHAGYNYLDQFSNIEAMIDAKIDALLKYWNKEKMNEENAKFITDNKETFKKYARTATNKNIFILYLIFLSDIKQYEGEYPDQIKNTASIFNNSETYYEIVDNLQNHICWCKDEDFDVLYIHTLEQEHNIQKGNQMVKKYILKDISKLVKLDNIDTVISGGKSKKKYAKQSLRKAKAKAKASRKYRKK